MLNAALLSSGELDASLCAITTPRGLEADDDEQDEEKEQEEEEEEVLGAAFHSPHRPCGARLRRGPRESVRVDLQTH